MKSVSKKDRRRGGAPSLREKPVCGLSSHSAKLRAENYFKSQILTDLVVLRNRISETLPWDVISFKKSGMLGGGVYCREFFGYLALQP